MTVTRLHNDLAHLLASSISHLLENRNRQGHWGDVRSTAIATWAFAEVLTNRHLTPGNLPEMRTAVSDAQTWLSGQARREEGGVSWDSEAWDTALSIIALSSNRAFGERLDLATAWLERIRDRHTGVWYDEVWETTLSVVSLLRAEKAREWPLRGPVPWLEAALSWFLEIPSKSSGEYVCPHYSGLIALLLGEIRGSNIEKTLQHSVAYKQFQEKVLHAVDWLIATSKDHPDRLWSSYSFANAYVGYGLTVLSRSMEIELSYAQALVAWLREHQGRRGGFEDVEDTSAVVLALSSLVDRLNSDATAVLDEVSRLVPATRCSAQKCFLGYAGRSHSTALYIMDFLRRVIPDIEIVDWKWDLRPGHLLFAELDAKSKECQAAIFLVTRDDEIIGASGVLQSSPRDNIVFEVGYFAARLGMDRTILLVEEGAKLPTDWGGILYLPFSDPNDLSSVETPLFTNLKQLLRL